MPTGGDLTTTFPRFGRRVRRSAYTRSATEIGLAIQADAASDHPLRDVFSRDFGVWREGDNGRVMVSDIISPRGTPLPAPGEPPLIRAAHLPIDSGGVRAQRADHTRVGASVREEPANVRCGIGLRAVSV